VGIHALPESQHSRMLQDQVETIGEVPLIGTEVLVPTEEATVEGLVQTKGVGGTKKVVVKLFRRVDGKKKREIVAKTKTAADGSYKFSVKGSEGFIKSKFYIYVRKPKGYEFTKSKRCKSNVKSKNGKTKYFQVKLGQSIVRNACLQKEPETLGSASCGSCEVLDVSGNCLPAPDGKQCKEFFTDGKCVSGICVFGPYDPYDAEPDPLDPALVKLCIDSSSCEFCERCSDGTCLPELCRVSTGGPLVICKPVPDGTPCNYGSSISNPNQKCHGGECVDVVTVPPG